VLSGVDLEARAGEIVAVRGANGSGKSTLLEVLALLRRPSAGEVRLLGATATPDDRARRRGVTLVMQPSLLLRGGVLTNVAYGLRARGVRRAEAGRRALEALGRVGAPHLADRAASELSAGERQRVGLARALVLETPVLLLDEPTANLDDAGTDRLLALLAALPERGGTAVVVSTPGDPALLALADRVISLDR